MPPKNATDPTDRLNQIAAGIARGIPASRFKDELDQLLGTEMEERDPDVEAAWEEDYRNGSASAA